MSESAERDAGRIAIAIAIVSMLGFVIQTRIMAAQRAQRAAADQLLKSMADGKTYTVTRTADGVWDVWTSCAPLRWP